MSSARPKRVSIGPQSLIGQRFGKLVVLEFSGKAGKAYLWRCQCECGQECRVRGTFLRAGRTVSCGCMRGESAAARNLKHGHSLRGHLSREYRSWQAMNTRCHNPNHRSFKNYGAKGISVCQRWRDSFEDFLKDMGPKPTPRHTLDRYPDRAGNYDPDNVRWASPVEQANNQSKNRRYSLLGRTQTLTEWVRELGLVYSKVRYRLDHGWSVEAAFGLQDERP